MLLGMQIAFRVYLSRTDCAEGKTLVKVFDPGKMEVQR
jgi:hypothetical protein